MRLKHLYILSFVLFASLQMVAQDVSLTTTVSKSKLGIHQRLKVEFSFNKQGGDNFKLPELKDFDVLGGPSTSVSQSWINGKSSYTQGYIYIFKPKRIGTLSIPPATIEYEGELISSNEVKVTVVPESEIPKDPNDPSYIASENVHLVAEISDTKPYVGESVYVVYKMYFSSQVGLSDYKLTNAPQYNGFWNQDIQLRQQRVETTTYKGEKYRYLVLSRALLIPQKSGELEIPAVGLDALVDVPTGKGDFFGNPITRRVTLSTKTKARKVKVKALPLEGQPEDFNGAVGKYDFSISATKDILRANETTQVSVSVTGKGNLKLFELPEIETPNELEVYTPEHSEDVRTTLTGLSGTVKDSYTIVPEYKGKYRIPEVSFSYFDVDDEVYKTITTEPLIIDVAEGKSLPSESTDEVAEVKVTKEPVVAVANDFKFIQLRSAFQPATRSYFFKSSTFYTLLLVPFILIPIALFISKRKERLDSDIEGKRLRKADKLARKYLSQAKKQLGKKEAFYIALEKALHNYLKAKLKVETSEISQERISELLEGRNVSEATIKELIEVLNDCDFARYTPTTNVMMQQEFDKAKVVLAKLDKQI